MTEEQRECSSCTRSRSSRPRVRRVDGRQREHRAHALRAARRIFQQGWPGSRRADGPRGQRRARLQGEGRLARARAARTPSEADKRRVARRRDRPRGVGGQTAVGTGTAAAAAKAVGAGALAPGSPPSSSRVGGRGTVLWVRGKTPAPTSRARVVPARAPDIVPLPPARQEAPAADVGNDPLLAEVTLLRRAQRALHDGKPTRRSASGPPRDALPEVAGRPRARRAARVRALRAGAQGRGAHARGRLLERAPRSPLRASLAESCALK